MRGLTRGKRPPVYSERQREKLRAAGRFNSQLMDFVRPHVQPDVATIELDRLVAEYTRDHGHTPACLGYKGYTKHICNLQALQVADMATCRHSLQRRPSPLAPG